tara:strand:+ start:122 stop:367 length:246 start_codon:yes stop_codon:yes gene_type:complete
MSKIFNQVDRESFIEPRVKTTPENVAEATSSLFHAKMTLPAAAKHCGMTQKEMKLTFWEYLKYNEPDYDNTKVPQVTKDTP